MGKTYKGCFAAVFIFLDFLVLLLSYRITLGNCETGL